MTTISAPAPSLCARTLALVAVLTAALLVAVPAARSGGGTSIVACSGGTDPAACSSSAASVSALDGVYFEVTTGGGNRDYASVEVICDNGYGTILNVAVPPKGAGTSQTIYPSAGSCTANLEKQMSIGKARVLASISFTVT